MGVDLVVVCVCLVDRLVVRLVKVSLAVGAS